MNTPIFDFIERYVQGGALRLHMPGHKGKGTGPLSSVQPFDITEIKGADSLYDAQGIIKESEENASRLFGSEATLYSGGGSTLCIQTMLALAARPGSTVIAARNAHKAFVNACVLLDLGVEWVFPQKGVLRDIVSFDYTPEDIERAILSVKEPSCVYITSPDYYGRVADVKAVSEVCRKYELPLLVDNAHGAHLAFLEENRHPLALGADMCCDSAHKMLPVLTGGAYLHIQNRRFIPEAKDAMALFGSTSPSYLLLCSLDLCNRYLAEDARRDLKRAAQGIACLKERLAGRYEAVESEPLRLTLHTSPLGMTGTGLAQLLRKKNIECEYADHGHIVLLFSSMDSKAEFDAVYRALADIPAAPPLSEEAFALQTPERILSIRQASLTENETVPVEKSVGRICGKTRILCPPGIPVVVAGEKISENCMNILKGYSILTVNVVK